jgi:hypothetical protein
MMITTYNLKNNLLSFSTKTNKFPNASKLNYPKIKEDKDISNKITASSIFLFIQKI